jgi:hypothetical protein
VCPNRSVCVCKFVRSCPYDSHCSVRLDAMADENRKSLEVLDLCPQLVAMLSNLMRQHIASGNHAGFVASQVVHSAVNLLKLLCVAGTGNCGGACCFHSPFC